MSNLIRRLRDPAFGTETSEHNLMNAAADQIDELLEVLREACEEIGDLRKYANNHGAMFDDETFERGLAAIAKAQGEA